MGNLRRIKKVLLQDSEVELKEPASYRRNDGTKKISRFRKQSTLKKLILRVKML